MTNWNDVVLQEFHDNDGTVQRFGSGLVVLHTIGARSGEARVNPVASLRDGDGWLVAATFAGQPVDPAWAHNLRAHPDLEIETASASGGIETVAVHAVELPEPERTAGWQRFKDELGGTFLDYEAKTDRVFPIFRLSPR
ncbi:nitroreductase/quinone reductase family protein [Mesorhizobium japonicum]|uniref:nitroreductase/quinone reductase family protein n=1 Tax=Mesorhizobium japonicum TaxID=2066070 RepID=UPI003B5D05B6